MFPIFTQKPQTFAINGASKVSACLTLAVPITRAAIASLNPYYIILIQWSGLLAWFLRIVINKPIYALILVVSCLLHFKDLYNSS